jgi:hypothetical protein
MRSTLSLRSILALGLGLASAGCRHLPPPPAEHILPLERVRLYETGVAYFERSGKITGSDSVSLPVPASHLDDALKTLTVFGHDGKAFVHGLEFGSSVSKGMGRALAGLPLEGEGPIKYKDLLTSLKGSAIVLYTTEGRFRGRLIDVLSREDEGRRAAGEDQDAEGSSGKKAKEKEKTARPGASPDDPGLVLLLLDEEGAIWRIPTSTLQSLRPVDPTVTTRLDTALDALSRSGVQSRKLLRLLASSSGPVTLGYIAEAPLWRTSYRLVFEEGQNRGRLQGWALLHNDSDENWSSVRVELVSGRPDSFLFPLAAPRYLRRELVHPDDQLATVPQLLIDTADGLWGDQLGDSYGMGGLGTIGHGSGGGGGSGYGHGSGRLGGRRAGADASDLLRVGNLAAVAEAAGVEAGALFTYALAQPLDLRAHGSALVPFLDERIDAVALSLAQDSGGGVRSAVRLTNNTKQTLATGPISFFEGGRFAGESVLDRLKPGERRYLEHGTDLDVEVELKRESFPEETKLVTVRADQLEEHYLSKKKLEGTFTHRGLQPRRLHLFLRLKLNAEVKGADTLDFDTVKSQPVAIFDLPAGKKTQRSLSTTEGLVRRTSIADLGAEYLEKLAAVAALADTARAALKDAAARAKEGEATAKRLEETKPEVKEAEQDIERLREHLKAAGSGKEQGQAALVKRLLAAEDRLTSLKAKVKAGGETLAKQKKAVETALAPLKAK